MRLSRMFAAAALAGALFAAGPALAQAVAPASDTTVGLGGFFTAVRPALESFAITVVTGVITLLGILFKEKIGRDLDARHSEALHKALMTGVSAALNYAGERAATVSLDVRNKAIAEAILWAQRSVPDALAYFRIDATSSTGRDALVTLASAKLTQLAEAPSADPAKPTNA